MCNNGDDDDDDGKGDGCIDNDNFTIPSPVACSDFVNFYPESGLIL